MRISDELAERLDELGVTVSGIEIVLGLTERFGRSVFVPETGKHYTHAAVGRNTIWVEYIEENGEKLITDAYTHRMNIPKEYHHEPERQEGPAPTRPYCESCNRELVPEKLYLHYMIYPFSLTLPRCPQCGQGFLSPQLMAEKVAPLEKTLEDK